MWERPLLEARDDWVYKGDERRGYGKSRRVVGGGT